MTAAPHTKRGMTPIADVLPASPRLFFIHIMKTAGTTLRPFLEQHYHHDDIADPVGAMKAEARRLGVDIEKVPTRELLARFRHLRGHRNITDLLPEDFAWTTVLREPVARLHSLHRYWQRSDIDELRRNRVPKRVIDLRLASREMSLEHMMAIDDAPIERNFHDGQARSLVSNHPEGRHASLSQSALLAEGLRTLDRCVCVGLTEQFDEFVQLLCFVMRWPPPPSVQPLNVGDSQVALTAKQPVANSIARGVELDRKVYARARQLFDGQCAAMKRTCLGLTDGEPIPADLTAADIHELVDRRAIEALKKHGQSIELPSSVGTDMRGPIRGVGWLEREGIDVGRIYRWTGPATCSSLDLLVAKADRYEVEVQVISVIHEDILASAKVSLNGVDAERITIQPCDDSRVLLAEIPGSAVERDGFARITIHVPRTASHQDVHPDCPDSRQKGLAITRITLAATNPMRSKL
jgi:hypothetical protein